MNALKIKTSLKRRSIPPFWFCKAIGIHKSYITDCVRTNSKINTYTLKMAEILFENLPLYDKGQLDLSGLEKILQKSIKPVKHLSFEIDHCNRVTLGWLKGKLNEYDISRSEMAVLASKYKIGAIYLSKISNIFAENDSFYIGTELSNKLKKLFVRLEAERVKAKEKGVIVFTKRTLTGRQLAEILKLNKTSHKTFSTGLSYCQQHISSLIYRYKNKDLPKTVKKKIFQEIDNHKLLLPPKYEIRKKSSK